MVGITLAVHALVSLLLLTSAVAHCLPRISHHQVAADLHHHGGGHEHADHGSATPDPQDRLDDCCGVLCRAAAGHVFAPAPDLARVAPLAYAIQAAPQPDERPIFTSRWSLLPLGSRAPPIAA